MRSRPRTTGSIAGSAVASDLVADRVSCARPGHLRASKVRWASQSSAGVPVGGPGKVTSDSPWASTAAGAGYHLHGWKFRRLEVTLIPSRTARSFARWDGPARPSDRTCASSGPRALRTETAAAFGYAPAAAPEALSHSAVTPCSIHLVHVTSLPGGENNCPPTCTASFASGTVVTLYRGNRGPLAAPVPAQELDRCAIVVDAPTQVDISPPAPPPDPERPPEALIEVTVSGPGLVTSSDGRIRCGRSREPELRCSELIPGNAQTILRLRTRARPGARFVRWSGGCSGAKPICSLKPKPERQFQTLQVTGLYRR